VARTGLSREFPSLPADQGPSGSGVGRRVAKKPRRFWTYEALFQRLNKSPWSEGLIRSLETLQTCIERRARLAEEVSTRISLASSMFLDVSKNKVRSAFGPFETMETQGRCWAAKRW
jgi:hypothetical protein